MNRDAVHAAAGSILLETPTAPPADSEAAMPDDDAADAPPPGVGVGKSASDLADGMVEATEGAATGSDDSFGSEGQSPPPARAAACDVDGGRGDTADGAAVTPPSKRFDEMVGDSADESFQTVSTSTEETCSKCGSSAPSFKSVAVS